MVVAVAAGACLAAGTAGAATASRLEYVRSPGAANCPDEQQLREAVAVRLGYDVFSPWAAQTVLAEITDVRGGLRARLRLVDEHGLTQGTRELFTRGHDCSELAVSLALAVSIALDPLAAARASSAERAPAPMAPVAEEQREPVIEPEPPAAPGVVAPPKTDLRAGPSAPRWALRAGAVIAIEALPTTAAGPWLGVRLGSGHWRLGAEARILVDAAPPSSQDKVTASLFVAILTGCYARGGLAACAVGDVGGLRTQGDTANGKTPPTLTLDVKAGARLEYARSLARRFDLLMFAELDRTITTNRFRLERRVVWQVPAGSAAFGLGMSLHFL
ncbi:MAG TPA: hypothetical protein VFH68_13655 [Polyangia bacterium]|nr:hypothetical protein [Polyangia bacterium]